ncbi:MAG: phenylalanine--tRNA ligase subunit beta [Candidatus Melainabacteria bacterium]|nr:phenylalanine--tRNA ligase subunit beta [Candidatus Melainabacteria bacterium]
MKLSIKWLENFVPLDGTSPEEVAKKLTLHSFEVEEVHKIGPELKGPIVVGKILEVQKHPNADRLLVARVTTDGKNQLQIVCGAKNIKIGQLIPVSLPGAMVINRQDGSKLGIKTSNIRGAESNGMLLSPSELGLETTDPNSILILSDNTKVGADVINYLSLSQDTVLEVAARSNRGDALSVYGLSKEISALTGKKLKEIKIKPPFEDKTVQTIKSKIEDNKDTCIFYAATIEDIEISESPHWLKNLLLSCGIKPVNNIVDITNYINFSFGQPLHAYDRKKLDGNVLTARSARKGEEIITIDGKNRKLDKGILVISDSSKPVAVAGIMGGKESEVSENTTDIVLEAAVFSHIKVRKGSRTIGLSTEASKRFERGVDSNFTYKALLYAINMIEEFARKDNTVPKVGQIQIAGQPLKKEAQINLEVKEIKRVLGIELDINETERILNSIEFKTKKQGKDSLEVVVPSSRVNDVTRSIDLVEEVARIYGYDKIPAFPPPSSISASRIHSSINKIRNYFLGAGFSETYLSSLIGEQILSNIEFPFDNSKSISMVNPLSKEHCVLRQYLLPGLLEALKLNQSYKNYAVRLFEIGKIYYLNKTATSIKETGVTEKLKIAGIMSGFEENWFSNKNQTESNSLLELAFFTMKGILERLFCLVATKVIFNFTSEGYLQPNLSLKVILNNQDIGVMGCLHPKIIKKHKLLLFKPVMVFELFLDPIITELEKIKTFRKISSQPMIERDITVDVLKSINSSKVKFEIEKVVSSFVVDTNLINTYELDNENVSLTYRLKMQELKETLTSSQADEEVNKIKNHLSSCLGGKFRV